jgi:hypothetical protein
LLSLGAGRACKLPPSSLDKLMTTLDGDLDGGDSLGAAIGGITGGPCRPHHGTAMSCALAWLVPVVQV